MTTSCESLSDLLDLFELPVRAGRLASRRRTHLYGDRVAVLGTAKLPEEPHPAFLLRRQDVVACPRWPAVSDLRSGDGLVVDIPSTAKDREAWVRYLLSIAAFDHLELDVAPACADGASLHVLWAIASARMVLGARQRVHARHDRLGLRLAQIALGFGADTLSGPLAPERALPLAGVTRPNEHSLTALCTLVRQVGLTAQTTPVEAFHEVQP